jgi:hypothetical protein
LFLLTVVVDMAKNTHFQNLIFRYLFRLKFTKFWRKLLYFCHVFILLLHKWYYFNKRFFTRAVTRHNFRTVKQMLIFFLPPHNFARLPRYCNWSYKTKSYDVRLSCSGKNFGTKFLRNLLNFSPAPHHQTWRAHNPSQKHQLATKQILLPYVCMHFSVTKRLRWKWSNLK